MRASPIDRPYPVREVITLASPYNLPTASTIEPLIRLVGSFYEPAINIDRLASPLPMRSTAIFSRDDGLVAWESCRREDEGCSIVEFSGPHLTVCRNPDVLRAVAASLGA
jgi:hypothetical protein